MNKAQWKAIYDYCKNNGFSTPTSLLSNLKLYGVVPEGTNIEELADIVGSASYEDMYEFLDRCMRY